MKPVQYARELVKRSKVIAKARAHPIKRNPAKVGGVTDRAHRYRANAAAPPKSGCLWCGSKRALMVAHIDGREENSNPQNLAWTCRACNTKCANVAKRAGAGRRTRQMNPSGSRGSWGNAILTMRGDVDASPADVRRAINLVQSTPVNERARLSTRMWSTRSNPVEGAKTLEQWAHFVKMMRSFDQAESDAGYAAVMATPKAKRHSYNVQLWGLRPKREKVAKRPKSKREKVPF